jgi:gluconolactonase
MKMKKFDLISSLFLVFIPGILLAADLPGEKTPAIIPANAKLEHLFTRGAAIKGGLTEGPAVAPDGSIFFSDIPMNKDGGAGMILRYDPRTGKTATFKTDSGKSNGLMFDAAGQLVGCQGADYGKRRLVSWNIRTGEEVELAGKFTGKRFNAPNDLVIDRSGRIYFTDPRYVGHESRELKNRAVYRVDEDGTVREITREVRKPNGIALSPDEKTLYVADHDNGTDRIDPSLPPPKQGEMKLYAFSLDGKGLATGGRKTLIDFGSEIGIDGMTTDSRGNLYLALRSATRPGILILSPAGKELGHIPTRNAPGLAAEAEALPSNCVFGRGYQADTLYVTIDTSLYRIRLNTLGCHLPTSRQRELLSVLRKEFVSITPGEGRYPAMFAMGRKGGPVSEAPARTVKMSGSFKVARYEVPQNLWEAVMGFNPSRWKGGRNSVEVLDLSESDRFCECATDLMRSAGLIAPEERIRLPSEAEWEYFARAGTGTLYSFGDNAGKLGDYGWFHGNAAGNDPPVGVKKPNPWGLYDIHGYLWEWCSDPAHPDYKRAPADSRTWSSGGTRGRGVLRGGSWKDDAPKLSSSYRRLAPTTLRDDAVGLRCVLSR